MEARAGNTQQYTEMSRLFPARMLSCFPFQRMNRVQQRVLPKAFASDGNLLVSAPTGMACSSHVVLAARVTGGALLIACGYYTLGSGKTAVLEAAFLRNCEKHRSKALYIAPTKAILQER